MSHAESSCVCRRLSASASHCCCVLSCFPPAGHAQNRVCQQLRMAQCLRHIVLVPAHSQIQVSCIGIVRALPLLDEVFWVAAGDVFAPAFSFAPEAHERFKSSPDLAHIWLVPNPAHNPRGDFGLSAEGLALNLPRQPGHDLFTFSTIALYKRAFFEADWCDIPSGNPEGVKAPLAAMLRAAMDRRLVSASVYKGLWVDVGTPQRLAQLNKPSSA